MPWPGKHHPLVRRRRADGTPANKGARITDALKRNLVMPANRVTTLAEMSPEKRAEMQAMYPPPARKP